MGYGKQTVDLRAKLWLAGCVAQRAAGRVVAGINGQAYDGHMNLILSDMEETIMT